MGLRDTIIRGTYIGCVGFVCMVVVSGIVK